MTTLTNTDIKLSASQLLELRQSWVLADTELVYLTNVIKSTNVDYWTLIDRLVDGAGFIICDNQRYVPRLVGKGRNGLQLPGKRTSTFNLQFRQCGNYRYCLIQEQFIGRVYHD